MKIQIIINDKGKEPEKFNQTGIFALETIIVKLVERYISPKVSKEIENLFKNNIVNGGK